MADAGQMSLVLVFFQMTVDPFLIVMFAGANPASLLRIVTVVIVGIFVSAVIWPPPPPPGAPAVGVDASAARVALAVGQAGRWTVTAEVALAGANAVAIAVSIADAEGRAAGSSTRPTAVLRMVDMAMGTEEVNFVPDTPGHWRGSGRLSMTGRWLLELDLDGGRIMVPFVSTR